MVERYPRSHCIYVRQRVLNQLEDCDVLLRSLSCTMSLWVGAGQCRSRESFVAQRFARLFAVKTQDLRVQQKTMIGFFFEYFAIISGILLDFSSNDHITRHLLKILTLYHTACRMQNRCCSIERHAHASAASQVGILPRTSPDEQANADLCNPFQAKSQYLRNWAQ